MKYKLLLIISIPIFLLYIILCFVLPILKFGKKEKQNTGTKFYVIKDKIHSDFLFEAKLFKNFFKTKKKYIIIGWGDRKIFLETKKWESLKIEDFLKAFYGLNSTVLRVVFTNYIPKNKVIKEYKTKKISLLVNHIKNSFINKKIRKRKEYHQIGTYYESKLKYNCITNCNNWINLALRKCHLSNRVWTPISFWI